MDPDGYIEKPVRRDEPHWYLTIIDSGCPICCARDGERRVRMPGKPPAVRAERYRFEGGHTACNGHFL